MLHIVWLVMDISIFFVSAYLDKEDGLIYILVWQQLGDVPLSATGVTSFVERNCSFQNCFVTKNRTLLNITDFDAIMFSALNLSVPIELPNARAEAQKYILSSIEPGCVNTIRETYMNDFFNLTWTYKLDSDIPFPYFVVKNDQGDIIGPKTDMHWKDIGDMREASAFVKNKLQRKSKAATWFVSHCEVPSKREYFVRTLDKQLAKYNLGVDIYGVCGKKKCPNDEVITDEACYAMIETTYYFYLAFENSLCEDYVTEKIVTGLEHYTVPIVFGGANYTRFVPDGTYLNARNYGPKRLAKKMNQLILDKEKYYDFFRWHDYYSFHRTKAESYKREVCGLCSFLNDHTRMRQTRSYDMDRWWNGNQETTSNAQVQKRAREQFWKDNSKRSRFG